MTSRVPKAVPTSGKSVNRLHVAIGSKLVVSAEGFVGIAALVALVAGLAFVVGGLRSTLLPWRLAPASDVEKETFAIGLAVSSRTPRRCSGFLASQLKEHKLPHSSLRSRLSH